MASSRVESLLVHYRQIFILCKFLGIYPHDKEAFLKEQALRQSKLGNVCVGISMLTVIVLYNLLIYSFSDEDRSLKATQSTLTFVIGLFLTYIGLVMMMTDQLNAIKHQSDFSDLFERIRAVDERLFKENVVVDNSRIEARIRFQIVLAMISELVIMLSTYFCLIDYTKWTSVLWICSSIPTFLNSLDKIWFATTLYALKQRFEAINISLEEMVESHEKYKAWLLTGGKEYSEKEQNIDSNQYEYELTFMNGETFAFETPLSAANRVAPIAHSMNSFGECIESPKKIQKSKPMVNMACESELNNVSKVEEKFNIFCQLHDEICEIGKTLNELWSYPILILMAYGFLIFTAQLYFLYCATQNQAIPSLFRSAKNAVITAIYLGYASGKCIYLIYLSWRTSLESKRTGICLHKCGVTADDNVIYEIINHLSLKLLNHSVNFSACGFFTLDMETLYGVSGGITSYLIILIQFNLAAQQAKDAAQSFSAFNETANLVAWGNIADNFTSTLATTTVG